MKAQESRTTQTNRRGESHKSGLARHSAKAPRNRPSREARLLWLDAEIRARRYPNAQTMADALGVSPRTAWGDAALLRDDLNAPLDFDKTRNGWFYAESTFALPYLYLTGTDAAALRRSLLAAIEFLGDADAQPLRTVIESLANPPAAAARTVSPAHGIGNAAHLANVTNVTNVTVGGAMHLTASAVASSELLETCQSAVDRHTRITLRYHGAHRDKITDRTVRPYHLHNDRGEWYLFAHCELRDALRTFSLGRVEQFQIVGEPADFRIPADFDARALIESGFHLKHGEIAERVVIRFDPYQARWAKERIYHSSQTAETLPDGSLELTFHVGGLEEIKRWVMSFGSHAQVLHPAALRQEIADEIRRLEKIYE